MEFECGNQPSYTEWFCAVCCLICTWTCTLADAVHSNLGLICLSAVLLGVLTTCAQTEMKKVVGDNATLPCHHQFWVGDDPTLDIEWLLLKPTNRQRVVSVFHARG